MPFDFAAARRRAATVMGINRRNLELVLRLNRRRFFPLADNKVLAKSFLSAHGIPTARTYGVYDAFYQLRGLGADLRTYDAFVIKPSNGRRGQGIVVIKERRDELFVSAGGKAYTQAALRRHAAAILFGAFSFGADDRALIEECLIPHSAFNELSPQGLPDLRVILVEGKPILGMLRLATQASDGKANLHQGGVGLGIDLKTGRTTTAITKKGPLTRHPDTGAALKGVAIPQWHQVVEISQKIGRICPLRFLGIDLTVDADQGPVVLEFNARPGLEIQNANAQGIRALFDIDDR